MKNQYTCPADMSANEWLAKNGICIAQLIRAENELIKAKKIVQFLLLYGAKHLDSKERTVFSHFLQAMCEFQSRKKLSSRHAYKIIAICKAIIQKLSRPKKAGAGLQKQATAR